MYDDIEEMLTRELRQVGDDVEVPPLPDLPSGPQSRSVWQPLLAAAAVVLIVRVASVSLLTRGGSTPQPAPRPTDVVTDDATDTVPDQVPTGPPAVPYLLERVVHVGGESFPGYDWVDGTTQGWVGVQTPSVWWWGNGGAPEMIGVPLEQPPAVSPNGEYLAYLSTEGELSGFQTAPDGEEMEILASVPVRDDDGVGTRIAAVTDDGWVIASGRGVGVLWRPFIDGGTVDLTQTAPGQLVWQATRAGLVVVDGSGDARDPGSGRVYLADLRADGELAPIVDLPNFGMADVSGEWVAWVPADQIVGDVREYDEIQVRRLDGDAQGALSPPQGWSFSNTAFTFEDDQFFVARLTDGQQQRMARCSPALQKCVLVDPPNDPEGGDGEPLELGSIVLGGIEPVTVGKRVSSYIRQGYLVADPDPPCGGNHWLWNQQFSKGLYVSASQDGIITALGTDKEGLETADGIGVGSSLRALKATYGEFLAPVRTDDQGEGWVSVKEGDGWFAFSLGPAQQVTDASRVRFIEVGKGDVLHHFSDAC